MEKDKNLIKATGNLTRYFEDDNTQEETDNSDEKSGKSSDISKLKEKLK